jgi:tetratricopeptide (TPR) repeat protein
MNFILKHEKYWPWIIFVFAILLYANTIPNDYNMDDELVTINHRNTSRGLTAIPDILSQYYYEDVMGYKYEYRPVVHISFAIEHELLGESPHISHAINVLLYAITCLLLFIFLKNLFPQNLKLLAWIATLLFVFHPIHTEVVASIKNRDEILALLFALCSGIIFLKAIDEKKYWLIFPSVLLFVIGCYSKITIIPLSLIFPISLLLFRKIKWRNLVVISIPYFLIGAFLYPISTKFSIIYIIFLLISIVGTIMLWNSAIVFNFIKNYFDKFIEINKSWYKNPENWFTTSPVFKTPFEYNNFHFLYANFFFLAITLLSYYYGIINFVNVFVLGIFILFSKNTLQIFLSITFFNVTYTLFSSEYNHAFFAPLIYFFISILILRSENLKQLSIFVLLWILNYSIDNFSPVFTTSFHNLPFFAIIIIIFKKYVIVEKYAIFILILLVIYSVSSILPTYASNKYVFVLFPTLALLPFLLFKQTISRQMGISNALIILLICIECVYSTIYHNHIYSTQKNQTTEITTELSKKSDLNIGNGEDRPLNFVEYPIAQDAPMSLKIKTGLYVFYKYTYKSIIPHPMGFYYGYAYINPYNLPKLAVYLTAVFIFIIGFGLIYLLYSRRSVLFFGLIIYFTSILQFLNFFNPLPGVMGDRYLWIPSLGFCILIAFGLIKLKEKVNANLSFLLLTLITLTYTSLTISRNLQWKNKITLFESDINYLNKSAQAQAILGYAYMNKAFNTSNENEFIEYVKKAKIQFENAIEIYPEFVNWWYDLGRIQTELGMMDDALISLKKSTVLEPGFLPDPYFNIANIYKYKGKYNEAIFYYKETLKWGFNDPSIHNSIAESYIELNNIAAAESILIDALKDYPHNYELTINLAVIYLNTDRKKEALNLFEKAYRINNNEKELPMIILQLKQEIENEKN